MKKVLATTMATLLFGLSFPVNTFALPNNESVTINQNSNMQLIQNPQNGQLLVLLLAVKAYLMWNRKAILQ